MMTSSSTDQEIQQKIQLFDIWALFYDDLISSIFYKTLHRRLLDYLKLPKTPWVLDLGCGTGRLLDRLANIYQEIPIGAGKIRVYSFSKREEMGKQIGFNPIHHHWLLGPVGLTIFEKS